MFSQCIPIFFGTTIISRVKLLLTDGAITEYTPFITNMRHDNPFINSCHGLCYYYLAEQCFQRNVSPSIPNDIRSDLICNEYIKLFRLWVKLCFFLLKQKSNIITHIIFIQVVFNSLREILSTNNIIDQMSFWIKTKLDPFQNLWLNHKKLYIQSFNFHITSISEAMHSSMKTTDTDNISNRRSDFSI